MGKFRQRNCLNTETECNLFLTVQFSTKITLKHYKFSYWYLRILPTVILYTFEENTPLVSLLHFFSSLASFV